MSRSGRSAAALVEEAWRRGARFDAWSECFNEQAWRDAAEALSFDVDAAAQTSYPTDYVMPWDHISCGASPRWLARERHLAEQGITTPDCTFDSCSGCGVCMRLGAENRLASSRMSGSGGGGGGYAQKLIFPDEELVSEKPRSLRSTPSAPAGASVDSVGERRFSDGGARGELRGGGVDDRS